MRHTEIEKEIKKATKDTANGTWGWSGRNFGTQLARGKGSEEIEEQEHFLLKVSHEIKV